jgi:hypothetical protein
MNPALIAISRDVTEHLLNNETEAAIAKMQLLEAEIERANCKHPEDARIDTIAYVDPDGLNFDELQTHLADGAPILPPTYAFRCGKCGRYVVNA